MSDIVSPAGQTVIRDDKDCHRGHHNYGHYEHGHYRHRDSCDDNGHFHVLGGQRALSHEIGESGRFTDAGAARTLAAIHLLGENDAARALALAKNISDGENRTMAAIALSTKSADDNARAILKEINDNSKAVIKETCDAKVEVLKAVFEGRLEAERTACKLTERISEVKLEVLALCGRRFRDDCGGHGVVISK